MMSYKLPHRLLRCERGATIVEFAFVTPVLVLLIVGIFDMSHTIYSTAVLQGAMQKAGRDFSLEDARSSTAEIESSIQRPILNVAPDASIVFERKSYFDFGDVEQVEIWDDINNDGICNNNEPFEDANDNGQWDDDRGQDGLGGARDAVLLTATVTYDRLFPMATIAGFPEEVRIEASTVLRNQPYDTQSRDVAVRNCT